MKNESNQKLTGYNQGEDYSEMICFNFNKQTGEHENFTELYVTAEVIDFSEEFLTDEQIDVVQNYAEEVQSEIKDYLHMCYDEKQTQWSLMYG